MSERTSGSAFSLIVRAAEVCCRNRWSNPARGSGGSCARISSVTRWQPRGRGRNENSVCDTIGQERFMIVFSRGRRSTVFVGCLPAREGNFCRSVCKCFSRRKPFCKINALFRECGGTPGLSVAIASQSVREMWIKCYNFDSAARVLYEKFRYSKNPLYI